MAWWLFQNLIVTASLAALVAVICRTMRPGPVTRHALWVLVLLKFVMPPVVAWPWSAPDPLGVATFNDASHDETQIASSQFVAGEDVTLSREPEAATVSALQRPISGVSQGPRDLTLAQVMSTTWPWLLGVWAFGSALLLTFEAIRISRLVRAIRRPVPTDPAIIERAATLAARLGLRALPIITIREIGSPVIWCVGRPRLLWPASLQDDATDACIDGLLVHEMAHVKRRDHFVGWVELAASIVWWWNPCFWYVRSAMREQAELACDAWVISALPNGRRAYAESLLALSGAAVRALSAEPLAAVIGIRASSRRVLERRLVMIMKGRAPLRLSMVGLFSIALIGSATLPVWATASQQTPPATAPVPVTQSAPPTSSTTPTAQAPVMVHAPTTTVHVTPRPTVITNVPVRPVTVTQPTAHAQAPTVAGQHVTAIEPLTAIPVMPTPMTITMSGQHAVTPVPQATTVAPVRSERVQGQVVKTPPQTHTVTTAVPSMRYTVSLFDEKTLPVDGQQLLQKYRADRDAIQREIDDKLEARQQAFVKQLEDLQAQYTKAGKLDEAVAIRDYIRAGAGTNHRVIRK